MLKESYIQQKSTIKKHKTKTTWVQVKNIYHVVVVPPITSATELQSTNKLDPLIALEESDNILEKLELI